jgi:hypothetical protein
MGRPWEGLIVMRSLAAAAMAAACACVVAACSVSNAAPVRTTPGFPGGGKVVLDERDNGRLVHLPRGSAITVILHSTYWSFRAPTGHALATAAPPGTAPATPGPGGCVPGTCGGTVRAFYTAVAPGTAVIHASRVTCGEALRCAPSQGRFAVRIIVRR